MLSDEELARQTQAGSLTAFEALVSRYEHRVYAFVAQLCRNATDATDITQDTFVKAFQAISQFNPRHTFAAWLFTIARHKAIDHHRAAPPTADEPAPELPDHNDPAELMATQEERLNLWRVARRALSETQFQALWLKYAEDLSVAQIARVLHKTQTHVKVLLFRARLRLGRELEHAQVHSLNSRPLTTSTHPASRFTPEVSRL
jgi:RNA polymerase sigma-70 factor, ECF subfamily